MFFGKLRICSTLYILILWTWTVGFSWIFSNNRFPSCFQCLRFFWGWDGDRNCIIPTGHLDMFGAFAVCHDWQNGSWFLGSMMKMPKPHFSCFYSNCSLDKLPFSEKHNCVFHVLLVLSGDDFLGDKILSTIDLKTNHSTKKWFDLWRYPQMWIGLFLWGKFSSQAIRAGVSIDHCIGCKGKPRGNHGA